MNPLDPTNPQQVLIQRLNEFFNREFQKLSILTLPREAALAHALRTAELKILLEEQTAAMEHRPDTIWLAHRRSQDTLKHVLHRLYRHSTSGGHIVSSSDKHSEAAAELLTLAWRYSQVEDGLTSCRRGHAEIREVDPNVYRFELIDRDAEIRLAARYPTRVADGIAEVSSSTNRPPEPDEIAALSLISERVGCLGPYTFYFIRSPEVLEAMLPVVKRLLSHATSDLPRSWSIGPYTLEEFWCFWTFLFRLTRVQRFAAMAILSNPQSSCYPLNSPLIEMSPQRLVDNISTQSGLPSEVVNSIVVDLTYDPGLKFTDIMYQPLVSVGDRLLIMPSIIEGSSAERNLVVLWNKIPARKQIYETLSGEKESVFLKEIDDLLAKRPRKNNLARLGRSLTEPIDHSATDRMTAPRPGAL